MGKKLKGKSKSKSKSKKNRKQKEYDEALEYFETPSDHHGKKKEIGPLAAKNEAQGQMISTIKSKDITFVTGPAGTGKTYVATALAAEAMMADKSIKLILTRPMTGVGESMGHLPGDLSEKYAPWMLPVIEVLNERLGKGQVQGLTKSGRIQSIPLQFMRGMSLNDSFIILDEGQNATPEQMKMLLTRIGRNSKLVIDGDENQSDLRDGRGQKIANGLTDALKRLRALPEIGIVNFSRDDIVRNGLIKKILIKYED